MKYYIHIDEITRNGVSLSCISFINELVSYVESVTLYVYGVLDTSLHIDSRIVVVQVVRPNLIQRMIHILDYFWISRSSSKNNSNHVHIAYSFLNFGMKRHFYKQDGLKVGLVHVEPAHGIQHYNRGILKVIFRRNLKFLKTYDRVITLTSEFVSSIHTIAQVQMNKIVVIHNIFNISDTTDSVSSNKSDDLTIRLVYIGRLEVTKGLDLFVKIVLKLLEHQDVMFTIVGSGAYETDLKEQVLKHNLSSHFNFVGFTNDVKHYFAKNDYFVFPTESEGWPTVVMEALRENCKVVASDIPGNRALLTYDNKQYGYLLSRNADDFANTILLDVQQPVNFDVFDFNKFNENQIQRWLSLFDNEEF